MPILPPELVKTLNAQALARLLRNNPELKLGGGLFGGLARGFASMSMLEKFLLADVIAAGVGAIELEEVLRTGHFNPFVVPREIVHQLGRLFEGVTQAAGTGLFQGLIAFPLGLQLGARGSQERQAVETIERVLGLAVEFQAITAGASMLLESQLGDRAPRELLSMLKGLPNELGVNYFLGLVMADVFQGAISAPLREAVHHAKRPARFEWPQVRFLVKQKALTPAEAHERFANLGFREEDIPLLERLDRQLLTLADLQGLFEFGFMTEAQVDDYLLAHGLDTQDRARLITLYLHRAQTEGGRVLGSIARRGYFEHHLSEPQYRAILQKVNTPPASVDLLVEGVKLEQEWTKTRETVADLKLLFQHGQLDVHQTVQRLQVLNYSDADATALVRVWAEEHKTQKHGLSEARIVAYLLGGILDTESAFRHLLAGGMRPEDARFLVTHPRTHEGVFAHRLEPGTIAAAFRDQVLTIDQARALLQQIGRDPQEIALLLRVHAAKLAKKVPVKQPRKTLSEGQVIELFHFNLVGPTWTLRELETLGYADEDAFLLVALELVKRTGQRPDVWTDPV